jgi:hypothetical protein
MMENILTIMSGDASATRQYLDSVRRSEPLEPEKALLSAMLQDAIHDYRKYAQARDRDGAERFREAEAWLMKNGDDWIFSFRHVCEYLGLNPDYVRRGLREANARINAGEKARHPHKTHGRAA